MERRGLLLIISSPSGAGKSTLSKRLLAWDPTIEFSVSATTRAPRGSEVDGVEYHFLSQDEFEAKVAAGEMLEHARVFGSSGHYYGSPKAPVEAAMSKGHDTLFDIDWQGGQQISNSALGQDVISIFILPPSLAELEARLRGRGQDSDAVIEERMNKCQDEIVHWAEYDYVLVNRDVDAVELELRAIIMGERLRRERQQDLPEFIKGLDAEFEGRS